MGIWCSILVQGKFGMYHDKKYDKNHNKKYQNWVVLIAITLSAAVGATTVTTTTQPAPSINALATSSRGVPIAELARNAPESYVVKQGDTLWGIASLYLRRPWRWPRLWGMAQQDIAGGSQLIFPGQTLYLDKQSGYARLGIRSGSGSGSVGLSTEPPTVRISPRTRTESLMDLALPTLKPHLIEPFLVEPQVVDEETLLQAPRIVATTEDRVLMSTGDRAYARGDASNPLRVEDGEPRHYRVFRNATPLKDPTTAEILGYEAQYLGRAELVRSEGIENTSSSDDAQGSTTDYVAATLNITSAREEIRAGDRLLPAPPRSFASYIPHAPQADVQAQVVSIYGGAAFANAAQNQVVSISKGEQDGIKTGHVLHLMTKGEHIKDTTDAAHSLIKLPSESNGTAMVFRTFERVSYALILDVRTSVRVGDRLTNPH